MMVAPRVGARSYPVQSAVETEMLVAAVLRLPARTLGPIVQA